MIQTGLIAIEPRKLTAEEELRALLNLREQKGRMDEYDRIVKLLELGLADACRASRSPDDEPYVWGFRKALSIAKGECDD